MPNILRFRYLPPVSPSEVQDHILLNIMNVLSLLQFPNYHLMSPYLSADGIKEALEFFVGLNITDFMLKVKQLMTLIAM